MMAAAWPVRHTSANSLAMKYVVQWRILIFAHIYQRGNDDRKAAYQLAVALHDHCISKNPNPPGIGLRRVEIIAAVIDEDIDPKDSGQSDCNGENDPDACYIRVPFDLPRAETHLGVGRQVVAYAQRLLASCGSP